MITNKIDLFLGKGPLVDWTMKNIDMSIVSNIITNDDSIIKEYDNENIALSIHYPYILKKETIDKYKKIYNIHSGLLPYCRGMFPVFFSLFYNLPSGATLHEIDEGIDTGPIVDKISVNKLPYDTGYSLFLRVMESEKKLISAFINKIKKRDNINSTPQTRNGHFFTKKDFFNLKNNYSELNVDELFKLIRCLDFPGHKNISFTIDGEKFYINIER